MSTGPSTKVKFWAALIAGSIGFYIGLIPLRKYELVKYTPIEPSYDETGQIQNKPVRISFREATPLELKKEYKEELRLKQQEGNE